MYRAVKVSLESLPLLVAALRDSEVQIVYLDEDLPDSVDDNDNSGDDDGDNDGVGIDEDNKVVMTMTTMMGLVLMKTTTTTMRLVNM